MIPCTLFPFKIAGGEENMQMDRTMAKQSLENKETCLRFYQWESPTLSIGYNQNIQKDINTAYCDKHNIKIIRRPTGGKSVFHDNELTYCISSPYNNSIFSKKILNNYLLINEIISIALKKLGVKVSLYNEDTDKDKDKNNPVCFAKFAPYEILLNKKKVVGSAQRRVRDVFFQHGSILFKLNKNKMKNIFNLKNESDLNSMTSLYDEGYQHISTQLLINALTESFFDYFGFTSKDQYRKNQIYPDLNCLG